MGIKEIRETTESCKHCFMCRHACPTFLATKLDSHTPRGYALLLSQIDHGLLSFRPAIVDRFYQCSQCGLCREDCAYHWAEDEVVRNAREEIVAQNAAPARVKALAERLSATGSPYESRALANQSGSVKSERRNAEVLYFAGCSVRQSHPEIANAVDRLLGAMRLQWTVLEGEDCCGASLFELGFTEQSKQIAQKLAERIRRLSPKTLLVSCPHCFRALSQLYKQWGVKLPEGLEILHVTQYLDTAVRDGRLKLDGKRSGAKVAYHDPCQLGRRMGVYDSPRWLITVAYGAAPLELFHNRAKAECCGAGAAMFLTDAQIALQVARKRVEAAKESGAEVLVTACQNCKLVLSRAADNGNNLRVVEICELMASCI